MTLDIIILALIVIVLVFVSFEWTRIIPMPKWLEKFLDSKKNRD